MHVELEPRTTLGVAATPGGAQLSSVWKCVAHRDAFPREPIRVSPLPRLRDALHPFCAEYSGQGLALRLTRAGAHRHDFRPVTRTLRLGQSDQVCRDRK